MAVQAVDKVSETTPVVSNDTTTNPEKKDYTNMTAKEILNAEKAGESIPTEILSWAKENPDSKETYKASQGESGQATEKDTVSYKTDLEDAGFDIEAQCMILRSLSAKMEQRDLGNVQKMSPYVQQVPNDEQSGDNTTSEVNKALNEISNSMSGGKTFSKKGIQKIMFYKALNSKASDELNNIEFSLEDIQKVLDVSISCAKESKQAGADAKQAGEELKSSSKWWRFGKKAKAKKTIEQGELTERMSASTKKLAEAIAKDNNVALSGTKNNIQTVEQANIEENNQGEQAPAESKTASATPAQTQPATTSSKPS